MQTLCFSQLRDGKGTEEPGLKFKKSTLEESHEKPTMAGGGAEKPESWWRSETEQSPRQGAGGSAQECQEEVEKGSEYKSLPSFFPP